ncbi:MAG TPA: chemotaxis protein CheA, partial [Peptococcaceae bacterium]|nr:chemotaxis protein CheA [Peptococcaceae bacterium]
MSPIDVSMEPMLDMFIFETTTLLEQLDEIMIASEKSGGFGQDDVDEIFRIMHTIKGSSAMMGMEAMSNLAHHVEDMFFHVRENPKCIGGNSESVFDLVFQSSDSFKREIESVTANADFSPENDQLIHRIMMTVANLKGETSVESTPSASVVSYKQTHYVKVFFEDDCQMENIRAFMLLAQLKELCDTMDSTPAHPEQDSDLSSEIVKNGLLIAFTTTCPIQDILGVIENSINIKSYELLETAQDGPL